MASKMIIPVMLALLLALPAFAQASIDPAAPLVSFQMAVDHYLFINDPAVQMRIMSFHASSNNWILFYRHDVFDEPPYDDLQLTVDCDGLGSQTFQTTDFPDWVSRGAFSIEFPYGSVNTTVSYNSIPFIAQTSTCFLSVADGLSSYDNNTYPYDSIQAEMIPYLAALEFLPCDDIVTTETQLLSETGSIVDMMTGFWQILWLVYSIFIVVVAVFMVPILIFIIIRWAVYRLAGVKLIENKSEETIVLER
jgi:hypothetical protein